MWGPRFWKHSEMLPWNPGFNLTWLSQPSTSPTRDRHLGFTSLDPAKGNGTDAIFSFDFGTAKIFLYIRPTC
jgi:hypothetical protein